MGHERHREADFCTPDNDIYRRPCLIFSIIWQCSRYICKKGRGGGSEELLSLLQQMNGGGGWRLVYRLTRFECEFYFAIKSAELMLTQQHHFNEPSFYAATIVN